MDKPRTDFLSRAIFFLKFRPRSEAEVREYLLKKGAGKEDTETVIEKLKKIRLVDDREFIHWWVERRDRAKPKASRVLAYELKQLGVGEELIKEVLGDQRETDRERARRAAEKVWPKYEKLEEKQGRERLLAYLSRRGFSWDSIRSVVDALV